MRNLAIVFFALTTIFYSCENPLKDRVEELENRLKEQEEQQSMIDSLVDVLFVQQDFINSLIEDQQHYIDSLNSSQFEYVDSLNDVYAGYIDSLESTYKEYIDSLYNEQQGLIEMLIDSQPDNGMNYIRIGDVQICWGIISSSAELNVTFPMPFLGIPSMTVTNQTDGSRSIECIELISETGAVVKWSATNMHYQVIGKWR